MKNAKEKGRFVKGMSGNPGGRPALGGNDKALRAAFFAAAREYSKPALDVLAHIVGNEQARTIDRIAAANIIMDRAWGKPEQLVEGLSNRKNEIDVTFSRNAESGHPVVAFDLAESLKLLNRS